jgi:hypothetical protein
MDSVRTGLADDELVVVACDEVPMAIENIAANEGDAAARTLLQTMRALRSTRSRLRWLITGSIGFHHVTRLIGSSQADYADLRTVQMGPLDQAGSLHLARCLLRGIGADDAGGAAEAMADASGGIPYLIHSVAHGLRANAPVSRADVRKCFDDFVRDRSQSHPLTHLLTRLDRYYGNHAALARRVLTTLATAGEPLSFVELTRRLRPKASEEQDALDVVDMLDDDHYVQTAAGGIAWRYDVLRRIWLIRTRRA